MHLSQKGVHYYFKLDGNIADPSEIKFAKMEIEGLFEGKLNEVRNFVDVLVQHPLKNFLANVRVQDSMMRDVCYGQVQGFHSEYELTDVSDLVRRLAYTREIYVLLDSSSHSALDETLQRLYPAGKIGGDVQVFRSQDDSFLLLRLIAHTYYYENLKGVVYFSFAKTKERTEERVRENVRRLVRHVMEGRYHIPLHPSSRMRKEVEDLFDERKEVKLYLSHAFGPPYKAKFHPRMIKAMMNHIGIRHGILLDPFVGSGTMSIECTLTGINSIGVDISPVCVLATKAKVSSLAVDPQTLRMEVEDILKITKAWDKESPTQLTLDETGEYERVIVPDKVKNKYVGKERELLIIYKFKNFITRNKESGKLDEKTREDIYNIFMCALSKVVSKALRARGKKSIVQMFEEEIEDMHKAVVALDELKKIINIRLGKSKNYMGDVRDMKVIPGLEPTPEGNVQGIITSPPYSTAVDYIRNDFPMLQVIHEANIRELEENIMGNPKFKDNEKLLIEEITKDKERFIDLPLEAREVIKQLLQHEKKNLALRQYKFLVDMKAALQEMFRVLKSNMKCVIIIGNNHFSARDEEIEFKNAQYLYEMAPKANFIPKEIIPRRLLKTSHGAIREEYLLVLEKPPML